MAWCGRFSRVLFIRNKLKIVRLHSQSLSHWNKPGIAIRLPITPTLSIDCSMGAKPLSTSSRLLVEKPEVDEEPSEPPVTADLHTLVKFYLPGFYADIRRELICLDPILLSASVHHFDGTGKAFRPVIVQVMAHAINHHVKNEKKDLVMLLARQRMVAMMAEMVHVSSLVHDDVIDVSDSRRNKPTVFKLFGQKKAVLIGDYILAISAMLLAKVNNTDVVVLIATMLQDLVQGELMQLGSKEDESERFSHYVNKTFKKTASLMANTCKAVALIGDVGESVENAAFEYGRHVGLAFQFMDDLMDFVVDEKTLGKPAMADISAGVATAPVLFAAEQFPVLNEMIMRRFSEPGDVDYAIKCVAESDGIEKTRILIRTHVDEAIRQLETFIVKSPERDTLVLLAKLMLSRNR